MPGSNTGDGDRRAPTWVYTSHPSHRPYIAVNAETQDSNQNIPDRLEIPCAKQGLLASTRLLLHMRDETSNSRLTETSRFESFLLGEGEKKVEMKLDTRELRVSNQFSYVKLTILAGMPNTSIFHFNKEDHTLGNLLRAKLLTNSHVIFSGYKACTPFASITA